MQAKVYHCQNWDKDVSEQINKVLNKRDYRDFDIKYVTTAVPDPRKPGELKVLYEAYVAYTGTGYL